MTAFWLLLPSLLAGALSLSVALRRPPWFDELFTTWAVTLDWADLAAFVLRDRDAVHGTYYALLHLFSDAAGVSVTSLRLPSVVAMMAACLAVTLLMWEIGGMRMAVTSGLAFALLPITWEYGAEARGLALATALVAWSTYVLVVQLTRGPRAWRWVLYAVLLAAAGYVFLWAVLVALSHVALLLVRPRPHRRLLLSALGSMVGALVLMGPLLVLGISQRSQLAWLTTDELAWVREALAFPLGAGGTRSLLFGIALWLALVAGSAAALRSPDLAPGERRILVLGWAWVIAPVVVLWAISLYQPAFAVRYLTVSAPGVAVLVGLILTRLPRRWFLVGAIVGLTAATVVFVGRDWTLGRDGWRDKAAALRDYATAGEGLAINAKVAEGAERLGLVPAGLVRVNLGRDTSNARVTPSEVVAASQWPSVVWLVPLDCPTRQDHEVLASLGYAMTRTVEVGSPQDGLCPVERYERAQVGS